MQLNTAKTTNATHSQSATLRLHAIHTSHDTVSQPGAVKTVITICRIGQSKSETCAINGQYMSIATL